MHQTSLKKQEIRHKRTSVLMQKQNQKHGSCDVRGPRYDLGKSAPGISSIFFRYVWPNGFPESTQKLGLAGDVLTLHQGALTRGPTHSRLRLLAIFR